MQTKDKILVSIGTIAVIAVASVVGYGLFATGDSRATKPIATSHAQPTASTPVTTAPSTATATPTVTASSGYKDGTYTASSSYRVPHGGQNSVSATLTIASGRITVVTTTNDYSDGESAQYVDFFKQEISSAIVGQSLADASVSRVGGASLTSSAFNDVLDTIRTQAKA